MRLAAPGAIELADFRAPGVLERFPQVTPEQCERAMQLIAADGSEVHAGAAAIVTALNTRSAWRLVTWLYRVPGIRQLADWAYRRLANNRFVLSRVLGLGVADCDSTSCKLHDHRR